MAKLVFPAVGGGYRSTVSQFRTYLEGLSAQVKNSPALKVKLALTLRPFSTLVEFISVFGTPAAPTSPSAVLGAAGVVTLVFTPGANSDSFEYAKNVAAGGYSAAIALPANRQITGLAAGSTVFKVRGLNQLGTVSGAYSVDTAAVTVT